VVVDVVIPALLKLVARDGDGKTTSLADEFSLVLEEDGVYKSYSLYKERRFAQMGYSAGAILTVYHSFRNCWIELQKTTCLFVPAKSTWKVLSSLLH